MNREGHLATVLLVLSLLTLLTLSLCAFGCSAPSTSTLETTEGTPPFGAYRLDPDGNVVVHANEGTWPVALVTDAEGADTFNGSAPTANVGFVLPDGGPRVFIHSPSDVTGSDWKISFGDGAEAVSLELGEIGISKSDPILAMEGRVGVIVREAVATAMVEVNETTRSQWQSVSEMVESGTSFAEAVLAVFSPGVSP